ncbi:MAG: TldD/PmbA family protein [Acidobacteria bacterium]|nr:TldD/PmbA family protein [Acidobacteriota bacterium]
MMDRAQRKELASWAVGYARKVGADAAAATIERAREIEVAVRARKIEKLTEATRSSLSLNLYVKGKFSGHTTSNLNRPALEKFIAEAVAMTGYLSEDPFRMLPEEKYFREINPADLQLLDTAYAGIETARRVKIAREIEEAALPMSEQIISVTASYSDAHTERTDVYSNGFMGERESTAFSTGADVTVKDGEKGRPEDWMYTTVRLLNDAPATAEIGKQAVRRALRKIGQKKIQSGVYDVVVENRSAARLLSGLYGPMTARALQQKRSFLEGKLGTKIASEALTVTDDPFVPKGLGSRRFDSEGLAAQKRVVIEKGVLKHYYVDNYYGRKLGMELTSGSPSNIVLAGGTRSAEEMIRDLKRGILITSFIGGNSNSTTGDYSFGIVGQQVENGQIVGAVNEMNLSGNLGTLWNQLVEVGSDPWIYSSWRLPSLRFAGLELSGA